MIVLFVGIVPAGPALAGSAHKWRTLTIHQAWLATKKEERHDTVQPQSACVRHSPYEVDCPFSYVLESESYEIFQRCYDTGRVREVAEQRFSFTALKPRCHLVVNKTP